MPIKRSVRKVQAAADAVDVQVEETALGTAMIMDTERLFRVEYRWCCVLWITNPADELNGEDTAGERSHEGSGTWC